MPSLVQRDADLSLRAAHEFVRPRVRWPADAPDDAPIALVASDRDADRRLADALCLRGGFIVMALRTADLDLATIALEWAAENPHVFGADPSGIVVAGGRLAAAAALHARDEGWPPLARQVLVGPGLDVPAGASLIGLPPATVVNAPAFARALRAAGVDVDELAVPEPMTFDWVRRLR